MGQSMTESVSKGLELLFKQGWGAEKESEADNAGLFLANEAGYNPQAFYDLLSRLKLKQGQTELGTTHPPFDARLNSLKDFMTKQGLVSRINSSSTANRFTKYIGALQK